VAFDRVMEREDQIGGWIEHDLPFVACRKVGSRIRVKLIAMTSRRSGDLMGL